MSDRYPLAQQGVFSTIQGEGVLAGTPMIFVRFAGCSVGCPGCDTDYSVRGRVTMAELLDRISRHHYGNVRWVWLTGGEPTDHNLGPLVAELHRRCLRVAVATAGTRTVSCGLVYGGVDFLSVSPHRLDDSWVQRCGDQLNIVPGLNGLKLADLEGVDVSRFPHRYVTPLADSGGSPLNFQQCLEFVRARPGWKLGWQAHKAWGLL